ncbi:MAG: hypothetical protein CM1200mP3_07650 [Chloroflexota bacterium]|nr:MAG: hypothetical protein CM1200mP3_07650 [Chloroflexota bacterium]
MEQEKGWQTLPFVQLTADILKRRLIDVAQEVIVMENDCGQSMVCMSKGYDDEALKGLFYDRIKYRYAAIPKSKSRHRRKNWLVEMKS